MVLYKREWGGLGSTSAVWERLADTFPEGDQLYNGVKTLIAEHLDRLAEERIVPAFPRSSGSQATGALGGGAAAVERAVEGDRFLRAVKGVWDDHTGSMDKIEAILIYMVSRCARRLGLTL